MTDTTASIKRNFSLASREFTTKGGFPQNDLLPIIPPGAKVNPKSSVDPKAVGKLPGRFITKAQEWWGLGGAWPTMGINDRTVAEAGAWPTDNVGLRAEKWPAVDIDTNSAEACEMIEAIANFHLGAAPVRVRDNAPRALLVFRQQGEEPVRKMRVTFADATGTEHALEVLGLGQQYLIAGRHPSGSDYEWRENAELVSWGAEGLTKVTASDLRNFMDAVVSEIETRGWTVKAQIRTRSSAGGAGAAVVDLEPVLDLDVILAALKSFPNDDATLPMREDFVAVIASFKAAAGKLSETVREDVCEWACEHGWADVDYFNGVWTSLTHVRIGPDRLFSLARKHGFHGDAAMDFRDDDNDVPVEIAEQAVAVAMSEEEAKEQALADVAKRLVYWAEPQRWIVRDTREILTHGALNSYAGLGTAIAPAGAAGTKSAANILINAAAVQKVAGQTYLPGKPQLVTWDFNGDSAMYFNRWNPHEVSLPTNVTDADIAPWLEHMRYLFTDSENLDYLLDYMAHVAQKRGTKIRWAPIIIGNQGVGKDLFLRPLIKGLGSTNTQEIKPENLTDRFVDFYEKELVVVQEMVRFDRGEVYEKIKAVISGTASDTVMVERKYETPYKVPNVVNMMFFSNHTDAMSLSTDDRRFFVISSNARPKPDSYYHHIAETFYKKQEGWKFVFAWLKQRDISKFQPDARPRMTEDKMTMIEETQPYYVIWFRDAVKIGALKNRSILTVKEILHWVASDYSSVPEKVRKNMNSQPQIQRALTFAGWTNINRQVRVDGSQERFWVSTPQLAESENEFLKAKYLAEREKKVASVG